MEAKTIKIRLMVRKTFLHSSHCPFMNIQNLSDITIKKVASLSEATFIKLLPPDG